MKKADLPEVPEFYKKYVDLVPDNQEVQDIFLEKGFLCWKHNSVALEKIGTRTYAKGKWTIPQLLAHIIDSERVFSFRMLAALRGDKALYPGFDEDNYAANHLAINRSIISLISELEDVRKNTFSLIKYASSEELNRTINANGTEVSAIQMAFITIGHSIHHHIIVQERYFTM